MRRIAYVQAYAIGNAADDYGMCHGAVVAGRVRIRSHSGRLGAGYGLWKADGRQFVRIHSHSGVRAGCGRHKRLWNL